MYRDKTETEIRFELLTWGAALIVGALTFVLFQDTAPSLVLFFPGLILLGSSIFQDIQQGWRSSWLTYGVSIVVVATGLAGFIARAFTTIELPGYLWLIIAIIELGAVFIVKAFFDPLR